jgi:hypothetical protein
MKKGKGKEEDSDDSANELGGGGMAPMETTNQNGKEQAEEPSEASLFLEV